MRRRVLVFVLAIVGAAALGRGGEVKCPVANGDFSRPIVASDTPSYVPPKLKKQTRPRYPSAARKQKVEGVVAVELLIDANGCVAATRVVESVPGLDEAARECVGKWRFTPAQLDGQPIATRAMAPVLFRLW